MPHAPSLGDRYVTATLGIAVLATLAVVFAGSPLPRLTPDSASYLTGAERLADDARFESCAGPITLFAPGYSAALAPLVALGVAASDAARVVNALATLALVVGAALLARAAHLSGRVGAIVAFAVAVSYATLRDGALVWSEPTFCALLVLLLVLALGRGRGLPVRLTPQLVGTLVLAWAVLLTRHSGVFFLPAVVLAAWIGSSGATHRLARVAALSAALVAAPAAWWARNVRIDDSPFGRRSGTSYDVLDVLRQLPDGLSSLALPNALPEALRLVVAVPLAVALVLAWRGRRRTPGSSAAVPVLAAAVAVYGIAVTLAAMRTQVDALDTRLLSPILAPVAVLVALGVSAPRTRLERSLAAFALVLVGAMTILAPGIVWRGHAEERTLANIPEDVSCADWPARYSATPS